MRRYGVAQRRNAERIGIAEPVRLHGTSRRFNHAVGRAGAGLTDFHV